MRILFVAMSNSIHTCRWINQLQGLGWDLHLFPSVDGDTHPDLREGTVHELLFRRPVGLSHSVRLKGLYWPFPRQLLPIARQDVGMFPRVLSWLQHASRLARLIRALKPDIVESMEIQHAGYLTLEARKLLRGNFPVWIVNNWGNDIYLFGRLAEHKSRIAEVLSMCDYYSCECQRDVSLARQLGFKGEILPVFPNCGGFDLQRIAQFRQPGPPSARRLIFLKGYQDWHGRALVGLRAIALCADLLRGQGYRVAIHSVNPDVKVAAELLSQDIGIPIEVLPSRSPDDILRFHGQARIHVGLAISDGIAITSIEAMVMGAFPIQSYTACCDEWIVSGETGLVVPPEDPEAVAAAIRKAITDDRLVDRAAELNAKVARERLDQSVIKPQVIAMYEKIASEAGK